MKKNTFAILTIAAILTACKQEKSTTSGSPLDTPANRAVQADALIITSLPTLPNQSISLTANSFYCTAFAYFGANEYSEGLQIAQNSVKAEGKTRGAQAFINAHIVSVSAERQGSKWHHSIVNLCGDFGQLN